jgi:hypothetical protein
VSFTLLQVRSTSIHLQTVSLKGSYCIYHCSCGSVIKGTQGDLPVLNGHLNPTH